MVPVDALLRAVAVRTGVSYKDLAPKDISNSPGRRRGDCKVNRLRQVLQFVVHRKGRVSCAEIGRQLGYNHSTVPYSIQVVDNLLRRRDKTTIAYYRTVVRVFLQLRGTGGEGVQVFSTYYWNRRRKR